MDEKSFIAKYPVLAPTLVGYFDMSNLTDEEMAREAIRQDDQSVEEKAETIDCVINDSNRLLLDIDDDWNSFGGIANRPFKSPEEASAWLIRMLAVWEEGLRDTRGSKPS